MKESKIEDHTFLDLKFNNGSNTAAQINIHLHLCINMQNLFIKNAKIKISDLLYIFQASLGNSEVIAAGHVFQAHHPLIALIKVR